MFHVEHLKVFEIFEIEDWIYGDWTGWECRQTAGFGEGIGFAFAAGNGCCAGTAAGCRSA
jgi:hypothetical protein